MRRPWALCVRVRAVATLVTATARRTCATSALPWRDLVTTTAAATTASTAAAANTHNDDKAVQCMVQLWHDCFAPRLFARGDNDDVSSTPLLLLLPSEARDMLLFVRALAHASRCIDAVATADAATNTTTTTMTATYATAAAQMRGLVVYMVRHALRDAALHVPSSSSLSPEQQQQLSIRADDDDACADDAGDAATTTRSSAVVLSSSSFLRNGDAAAVRLRRDAARERVSEAAMALPPVAVAHAVDVVSCVEAVLTCVSPLTHAARHDVYAVALSALAACDQLASHTLASLALTLARCAEAYATVQHITQVVQGSNGSDEAAVLSVLRPDVMMATSHGRSATLRDYVRPCVQANTTTTTTEAARTTTPLVYAPAELREEAALRRCRAGVPTLSVLPVTMLTHLHVLARAVRVRMQRVCDVEACDNAATPLLAIDGDKDDAAAVEAARRVRQAAESELALCTLRERKALQSRQCTPHRPTRRRSMAQIAAEAKAAAAVAAGAAAETVAMTATSNTSKDDGTRQDDGDGSHGDAVTLAHVADVCTALAVMRYGEASYWRVVSRYARWHVRTHAQAAAAATALRPHVQTDELLRCMRDIAFAADRVGQHDVYDALMHTLVSHGLLTHVIAAPSLTQRVLRERNATSHGVRDDDSSDESMSPAFSKEQRHVL